MQGYFYESEMGGGYRQLFGGRGVYMRELQINCIF